MATPQPSQKASSKTAKVPNKALYSRVSYLYQAAAYLATCQQLPPTASLKGGCDATADCVPSLEMPVDNSKHSDSFLEPASRRFISDLRGICRKAQFRIAPAIKNSLCKSCDTMLVEGSTCESTIENKSRGGKKLWADTLVKKCNTCGSEKRFPLAEKRQKRRPHRLAPHNIQKSTNKKTTNTRAIPSTVK